jgi:DNA-binding transcriptional LysR family regulator
VATWMTFARWSQSRSQSALSQTIRLLEVGLGVRLLTRTTRSVAPTEAGERLLRTVEPRFEEIDAELATIADLREKPAGTIRITATEYAIQSVLVPKLSKLLREYPDIKIEMVVDFGLTDIVAERYDAGVRSGEQVEKDMIAVRIGPNLRMAVAGAPSYFKNRSEPKKPQDLLGHNCINLRLPRHDQYLCLGVRQERPRGPGARRRAAHLQCHIAGDQCRACRLRVGLCTGRHASALYRQGKVAAGA